MTGYGEAWTKLRRYTIRTLREFGFGKSSSMGLVLNEEVDKFVAFFKNQVNPKGLVYVKDPFDVSTVNVLWRLITGKSHDLDDSKMIELLRLSREYKKSISVTDASIAYPFLRTWFPGWMGRYKQIECVNRLTQFLESLVDEHEEDAKNPHCFVDAFLHEIHKGTDPEFNREQLVYTLLDLFQGGAETTSKTLTFELLYMITYQDVQEKVYRELETHVPPGTSITLDIKHRLPYTQATLLEILRFSSIVPIPGPLECPCDITFRGFKIKMGDPVMINIHGCNMNETTWGDPLSFRPERFLDDEMNINRNASFIMSFGGGKRVCPGQILAESSMFMYFATLMRLFKFENDGESTPTIQPTLGLTYSPTPFFMRVLERNQ
ncbi:unnamed protein product [Orchesella dallaii]|uniref:Methyl farnesoate epoxidase n=1 Tax=Orchesella dallaii TaxID=48710 RepID=A0ABP1PL53_9HEXA